MRVKIFLFLCLALIIGGIFIIDSNNRKTALSFYYQALKKENISEEVVVNGKKYSIVNGEFDLSDRDISGRIHIKALRLAYAKTLAKRSPFFALSGTDPERLATSVDYLSLVRDKFSEMQDKEENSKIVKSSLYPIGLLNSLAELEQARLDFLNYSDEGNERKYKELERKTIKLYQREISNFKSGFVNAVSTKAKSFVTERNLISRDNTLEALDILLSGVKMVEMKSQKRAKCLSGRIDECETKDLEYPFLELVSEKNIDERSISQAKKIRAIFAETRNNNSILEGPIIALHKSSCVSDVLGEPLFVFYKDYFKENNTEHTHSLFIGNIRFIESNNLKDTEFFRYFFERDIKYVHSLPTQYYECPLSAYDEGILLAIRAVIDFAKGDPISKYVKGFDMNRAEQMEKVITASNNLVSEKKVLEYLIFSQNIAKTEKLPKELDDKIINLSLQFNNRSTEIDNIVLSIYRTEKKNINFVNYGILVPIDASYLFYVRSASMSLFFSQNPSFTDRHKEVFENNTILNGKSPFTTYSTLSVDPRAEFFIIKDLNFFFKIHKDLVD